MQRLTGVHPCALTIDKRSLLMDESVSFRRSSLVSHHSQLTIMFWWNLRSIFLFDVLSLLHLHTTSATWPLFESSTVRLLGLFQDDATGSEPIESSIHSCAMFKAAIRLSQEYNITIEGQYIQWEVVRTPGKAIDTLSKTCQAMSLANIVGIVGPALSREAPTIVGLGERVGIPVVSYSATDPELSDRNAYPAFYRIVPSDAAAALAIVKLFFRFNWTSCIIIYQNDAYGSGGAKAISQAFSNNGLKVINTLLYDIVTLRLRDNLKSVLSSSSTRVVLLWAESSYASLILQQALAFDVLGPHFTWLLSSSTSFNSFAEHSHEKLIGLLTIEPIIDSFVHSHINETLLNAAYEIWKQYEPETFPHSTKVNYYALFAFDSAWLLIQSLHRLCVHTHPISCSSSCLASINSSFCFDRSFLNSHSFSQAIGRSFFVGVTGPIQFTENITDRINCSHYFLKNAQVSGDTLDFVPVLKYSDFGGWQQYPGANAIIWPGSSLNPPSADPKLNGVELRIGVIESVPFTVVSLEADEWGSRKRKCIGYIPDLINLLQSRMRFLPKIELMPSNRTYDSFIEAVEDGTYDVIIGDVTETATRRRRVGFSYSIFDNSLRIIMRKAPDVEIEMFSFLKPFSRALWFLIMGTLIFATLLICLLERGENEALQGRSILCVCAMSVWYIFGNLVGHRVDFRVRTGAGRLVTVGLYVLSIVLVASYTANLASELTLLKSRDLISDIDDLKSEKLPFNRIGIRLGSAMEEYFLREISNGIRNFYPLNSRQEVYDGLLNNLIDAALLDIGVAEYVTNNIYCNLTLVGEGFDKTTLGILTPKDWLYRQDLDVNILSLRESGDLDRLRTKWFQKKTCPKALETSSAIDIGSLAGLFLIFLVVCLVSFFLFVWKKRSSIQTDLSTLARRMSYSVQQECLETKPQQSF